MAAAQAKKPSSKASQKSKPQGKSSGVSKKRSAKPAVKAVEQKTKSTSIVPSKKKRTYTDKELNIPQLNGIRPAGVQKRPNAKKGKNFVDDKEGMSAILAVVLAEKEGNIESKMMRARHLEEIREAKRQETEKRAESKKRGLEERKQDIKDGKKKRRKSDPAAGKEQTSAAPKKPSKRVSFG